MTTTEQSTSQNGFSTADLNELQRQLASWRQAQRGRSRLPEELWSAAAALARAQGVSWVARVLRLDYYKLKRRCPDEEEISPLPGRSPAFVEVELDSSVPARARPWRIELWEGSDARMTIEIGADMAALVAVVEAFRKRRP